jgi:hypothetical protein
MSAAADVAAGQTWRRRHDGKIIKVVSVGPWLGHENGGPMAFTCSPGDVSHGGASDDGDGDDDRGDGGPYEHDGKCCGWFCNILVSDCELVAGPTDGGAK